jgi:hypothetical protein
MLQIKKTPPSGKNTKLVFDTLVFFHLGGETGINRLNKR